MEMPQARKIRYDALIEPLFETLKPTKRLWPVSIRLALWIVLELGILALIAIVLPRAGLLAAFHNPHYLIETAFFIVAGVASAGLALRTAIPGRDATRNELLLIVGVALVAISLIVRGPVITGVSLIEFIRAGIGCLVCTVALASLPWLALFWAVRRGAPMAPETAGWLIGLAAFSFAFVASRLGCSIDNSMHVLMWHALPAAVGAALSMFAGMAWLERRDRHRKASTEKVSR
ncbi:MAG: NrsF family protein [Candidatus Binataceae bacterium]